jgi:hypothetical protein
MHWINLARLGTGGGSSQDYHDPSGSTRFENISGPAERSSASQEFYFIEFTRTSRVLFLGTLIRPSPQLLPYLATT